MLGKLNLLFLYFNSGVKDIEKNDMKLFMSMIGILLLELFKVKQSTILFNNEALYIALNNDYTFVSQSLVCLNSVCKITILICIIYYYILIFFLQSKVKVSYSILTK